MNLDYLKKHKFECTNCGCKTYDRHEKCLNCGSIWINPITEMETIEPLTFNEPKHYHQYEIDTIEFLQKGFPSSVFKGFAIGSAIKYLHRYENKNGIDDLKKSLDYIKRLIDFHKNKEDHHG